MYLMMLRMDTERIWDSGRVIQDSVWRGLHSYGPGAFSLFYIQRIGSYQYKSDLDIGKRAAFYRPCSQA